MKYGKDAMWSKLMTLILFVLLVSASSSIAQEVDTAKKWKYVSAFYLWGASIGGTSNTGSDIDIPFSDLFDKLNFGAMGVFGARKEKISFGLDIIYLNIEHNASITVDLGNGPVDAELKIKLKGFISTAIFGYTLVKTEGLRLNFISGVRYLWLNPKLKVSIDTPPTDLLLGLSVDTWNGIIGFNGNVTLSKKMKLNYYLDVGTGDNDFTLQTFGGLAYDLGKVHAVGGFRYLKWNFDDDDPGGQLFDQLELSGPYLGATYPF